MLDDADMLKGRPAYLADRLDPVGIPVAIDSYLRLQFTVGLRLREKDARGLENLVGSTQLLDIVLQSF